MEKFIAKEAEATGKDSAKEVIGKESTAGISTGSEQEAVFGSTARKEGTVAEREIHLLMDQVAAYIDSHYTDSMLSASALADEFHIGLSYLSRAFKERTGVGVLNYINRKRIDLAKRLLEREDMRVIAESNIRAVCVESRPHPDFCGPKWWKDMDVILDEAEKRGMKVWILDDSHFPTGFANGAMTDKPDELCHQSICYRTYEAEGGTLFRLGEQELKEILCARFSEHMAGQRGYGWKNICWIIFWCGESTILYHMRFLQRSFRIRTARRIFMPMDTIRSTAILAR